MSSGPRTEGREEGYTICRESESGQGLPGRSMVGVPKQLQSSTLRFDFLFCIIISYVLLHSPDKCVTAQSVLAWRIQGKTVQGRGNSLEK